MSYLIIVKDSEWPEHRDAVLVVQAETDKIDSAAADGLTGTFNSLAYRVNEIEGHIHVRERWIGAAAVPNGEIHVADSDSMTPFQADAGNDDWGAWVQVSGSADTPIIAGMAYVDAHRLVVADVERDLAITRIQLGGGDSGAEALSTGNYTELLFVPQKNARQLPFEFKMQRFPAGTKGWARCWVDGQNTGTVDFFIGLHEYEG